MPLYQTIGICNGFLESDAFFMCFLSSGHRISEMPLFNYYIDISVESDSQNDLFEQNFSLIK